MQWTTDLVDDWEEVPADPPTADGAAVEMNWAEDGFVLAPETGDDESVPQDEAVFSTVACKVGNDTADRERSDAPEPTGSAESPEL